RAHDGAGCNQFGGSALRISEMGFADLLAHRHHDDALSALAIIGLLPIIRGCSKVWRYIQITDARVGYIAYTGQSLQPNTIYRTGLTWKTPALEHHLEFEEKQIRHLRFKDGSFELRYSATVEFPETPITPDDCRIDSIALSKAASGFLLEQLQRQ